MTRASLTAILLLAAVKSTLGIVANPTPSTFTQPDGSQVTLTLHGDEYSHYTTAGIDDMTVVYDSSRAVWLYADTLGGELVATNIPAAQRRPAALPARITPRLLPASYGKTSRRAPARLHNNGLFDYTKFRGLIILVQYQDTPFTRDDIRQVFDDMSNKENFEGIMSNTGIQSLIEYTGSVRDYFSDNSVGMFKPTFDVVGPIDIPYNATYAKSTTNAQTLVSAALNAADDSVDYSIYDTDNDGTVDMVFFVFSGGGSNFSSNDSNLIWPHASTVVGVKLDGVNFGRYACSTELYGRVASKVIDGIGTICHEFSHVLGLADLYDTDYASSGGTSVHPSTWDVMAGGSYFNKSKTPCGFNLYERMALGFATPQLISEEGRVELTDLQKSNQGARINSGTADEFFLLESRANTRWDAYLPGEGLLVWRVDSTNVDVWENNRVNVNPSHNYFELLRATPKVTSGSTSNSDGDPFPGTGNVTELTNATSPSLRSWTGRSCPYVLGDISAASGTVSFTVSADRTDTFIEDFDGMPVTEADTLGVQGRFALWNLTSGACVVDCDGDHRLALPKGAIAVVLAMPDNAETIELTFDNPGTSTASLRLQYSTDGSSWTPITSVSGAQLMSVAAGASTSFNYMIKSYVEKGTSENPVQFRINSTIGSTTVPVRLNTLTVTGPQTSAVDDIEVMPTMSGNDTEVEYYDLRGIRVSADRLTPGIYIRRQNGNVAKVAISNH